MTVLLLLAALAAGEVDLTLADALAAAAQGSPTLARARLTRDAALAQADLTRPRPRPDIALELRGGGAVPTLRDPAVPYALVRRDLTASSVLTFEQTLLARGAGDATRRADAACVAALADYDAARQRAGSEVKTAWFELAAARSGLALATEGVRWAESQVQRVTDLLAVDRVAEIDRLQAVAGALEAKAALAEAEGGVALAQANLNRLLGCPDLDRPLVPRPTAELPAPPGDLAQAVQTAQTRRPEVRALLARLGESVAAARLLSHADSPSLAAVGSLAARTPSAFEPAAEAQVGLVLRIPLSTRDNANARAAAEAGAGAEQARAGLAELRSGIALEVRRAWSDDRTARRKLELATARAATAAEAHRIRVLQYERQRATINEVEQARLERSRAELDKVQADLAVRRAAAAWELALGL